MIFYKNRLRGEQRVCKELWAALAEREKEPLGFVLECGHQMEEMSSELGEEGVVIV